MTPEDEWRALLRIGAPWTDAQLAIYAMRVIGIEMRWKLWVIARACRRPHL